MQRKWLKLEADTTRAWNTWPGRPAPQGIRAGVGHEDWPSLLVPNCSEDLKVCQVMAVLATEPWVLNSLDFASQVSGLETGNSTAHQLGHNWKPVSQLSCNVFSTAPHRTVSEQSPFNVLVQQFKKNTLRNTHRITFCDFVKYLEIVRPFPNFYRNFVEKHFVLPGEKYQSVSTLITEPPQALTQSPP